MVLPEEDLTPDTMVDSVKTLYENRQEYKKAMARYGQTNGTHEIIKILEEI